jgi:hypothetical protein
MLSVTRTDLLAYWRDIAIGTALAVLAAWASYQGSQLITSALIDECSFDVWFNGDIVTVYGAMINRYASHRSQFHPLFSLMATPFVYMLKLGLHIEPLTAVRILLSAVAGLWSGGMYGILRAIGCRRLDAGVLTLLALCSAASIIWFVVPETYSFGSVSILLALGLVAVSEHRNIAPGWYVLVNAMTLGTTVTNWMAGMISTAVTHHWKKAFQIIVNAFCLVIVLWCVEKVFFPATELFLAPYMPEVVGHLNTAGSGGPLQVAKAFVFHSMVLPTINGDVVSLGRQPPRTAVLMSVQSSTPGSGSLWGTVPIVLLILFFGAGLWGLVSLKQYPRFRLALGLMLAGQLGLHVLYGEETFLYSLHWIPLLVTLGALGSLAIPRRIWCVLAVLLLLSTAINNGLKFRQASQVAQAAVLVCQR